MIIIDTNVISEVMRAAPNAGVIGWLDGLTPEEIATTAVNAAEIESGIALLPEGRRKRDLQGDWSDLRRDLLKCGVLAFGDEHSALYGRFRALRRRAGASLDELDLLVAAIAAHAGAAIATRNTRDFDGLGLVVINPWTEA